jgi:hypothetical protein
VTLARPVATVVHSPTKELLMADERPVGLAEGDETEEVTVSLGRRPIVDRPQTNTVVNRLKQIPGAQTIRRARPEDDPHGGWTDGDVLTEVRGFMAVETFVLIGVGFLVYTLWQTLHSNPVGLGAFGQKMPDGDIIQFREEPGTRGVLTVTLEAASKVTWWKDIEVRDANNVTRATAWTQDRRKRSSLTFPNSELKNALLVFMKAKTFGIHSLKYTLVENLQPFADKHLVFRWEEDNLPV